MDNTKKVHTKSRQTTYTLFTPDAAEYKSNLDLEINNTTLPMVMHPKVLGLTLDPKLTHSQHLSTRTQISKKIIFIKVRTLEHTRVGMHFYDIPGQ